MSMAQSHPNKVAALKESRPRKVWSEASCKRLFDLSLAIPAFVCSLPLFGVVAILIKGTSPGPVLFRQKRVGKGQNLFTIYKFRPRQKCAERPGLSGRRWLGPLFKKVV